jgi:Epoxide hydrolase N terminus
MVTDRPQIEPFDVNVADEDLEDLRQRLARARWPSPAPEPGWEQGTDLAYLRELVRYWLEGFDWRAQERRLNRLDHFLTEIDGQRIHFVHARSRHPDALPLVLSHGWPGSVVEFLDIFGPLTDHPILPTPSTSWPRRCPATGFPARCPSRGGIRAAWPRPSRRSWTGSATPATAFRVATGGRS